MRLCGGPPWAAVFGRPMARQPTALMKNGMPFFMILFGQAFAGAHLVSDSSRQLGLQKGAHLGTELLLLHREIEVHRARLFFTYRRKPAHIRRSHWPPLQKLWNSDWFYFPLQRSEEHTSELQSIMRISYAAL